MKGFAGYFLLSLVVAGCLVTSCHRGRVISASDMSDIYAEMFLADQWLNDNPQVKRTADTTWLYESIFQKFGYSFDDYDASVNYYLHHPEKYKKILDKTVAKLRKTQKALDAFSDDFDKNREILAGLGSWNRPVFCADSIMRDSSLLWAIRPADTLKLDSLVLDSLRRDSLRLDSLRLDSLRIDSLRRDSLRKEFVHESRVKRHPKNLKPEQ